MATFYHSGRMALALMLFSVGLAATSLAQAGTRFAGPRNTIAHTQRAEQARMQLLASRDDAGRCKLLHVVHHGHPGKGLKRLERIDVACGKSRLSAR